MRSSHLVAVLVAVFVPGLGAQTIRHVDAAAVPGGDGTSWATAYADLQDALREPGVDEVWIAEGRYLPDSGTVDWKLSFVLPPGIELLGGFRGDEDQRDQRDPALYRTELSGDLLGDDGANFTGRDENTRHVIDASGATPDTVLDGLVIRGGAAIGVNKRWKNGAAITATNASFTVRRCRFEDDQARGVGAAIHLDLGSLVVEDCTFTGNSAGSAGGAIAAYEADLIVRRSSFLDLDSGSSGGAVEVSVGSVEVEDCRFERNLSGVGAALSTRDAPARVTGSTFLANQCRDQGGGISTTSELTLLDSHFEDNVSQSGIAAGVQTSSLPAVIADCTFLRCVGRAVNSDASELTVERCRFEDNTEGGGLTHAAPGPAAVIDCTFLRNRAAAAAALWLGEGTVLRCTFTDDSAQNGDGGALRHAGGIGPLLVEQCVFEDCHAAVRGGALHAEDGEFHLRDSSFLRCGAAYGGALHAVVPLSLRVERCRFEACEATHGDGGAFDVRVLDATISDCSFVDCRASGSGGALYCTGDLDTRRTLFERCSAGASGGALDLEGGAAFLEQVEVVDGSAGIHGGAIASIADPFLCVESWFERNRAGVDGGALILLQPSTVLRCALLANTAGQDGGAVRLQGGSCELADSLLLGNHADRDGGAVRVLAIADGRLHDRLLRCTVAQNTALGRAGGIGLGKGADLKVMGAILWDNQDADGALESSQLFADPEALLEVNYSQVRSWSGVLGGTDNFGDDPNFVDAAAGDLHLRADSPCIDLGNPSSVPSAPYERDLDGNSRWLDGTFDKVARLDRGAYEFSHVRLAVDGVFRGGETMTVHTTGDPQVLVRLFVGLLPAAQFLPRSGYLFVDPGSLFLVLPWPGPTSDVDVAIPTGVELVEIHLQHFAFTAKGSNLSNAVVLLPSE